MVSLPGFEPGPRGPKPRTLPDYATESLNFGAGGETRTHGGFPPDYKSGAIAAMRLQHYLLFLLFRTENPLFFNIFERYLLPCLPSNPYADKTALIELVC